MLRWRLAGAALIILPTLACLWLDDQRHFGRPGVWLVAIGLVLAWIASRELATLVSNEPEVRREVPPLTVLAILILSAPAFRMWDVETCELGFWGWTPLALSAVTAVAAWNGMRRFGRGPAIAPQLCATLFCICFLAVPLAFVLALRLVTPDRMGLMMVASVIFVVKWSDAGAYFVGRLLGKTPLAPVLSPKKTREGLIGGGLFAIAAAFGFHLGIVPLLVADVTPPSWMWLVGYAVSLTAAGLLGDLTISLLKRDAEMKDSGHMLPGLGGCLDVIDSILWAMPVGYLWWVS